MMSDKVLPALPESDPQSLAWNKRSNYYTTWKPGQNGEPGREVPLGARDFWGKAEVTSHKIEDFKRCEHYFELKKGWYACQHCHFALQYSTTNPLTISKGQLLFQGKPLY